MLEEKLDPEMKEMVKEEISELEDRLAELESRLKVLLIPKDPNDDKNVIMEIRGAAGGDEAALFAGDLFRMYSKYAESQNWKIEVIESHTTGVGGFKEIIFMINGHGAYSKLKFENGAIASSVCRKPNLADGFIHQRQLSLFSLKPKRSRLKLMKKISVLIPSPQVDRADKA